jgi:hypothetical protein
VDGADVGCRPRVEHDNPVFCCPGRHRAETGRPPRPRAPRPPPRGPAPRPRAPASTPPSPPRPGPRPAAPGPRPGPPPPPPPRAPAPAPPRAPRPPPARPERPPAGQSPLVYFPGPGTEEPRRPESQQPQGVHVASGRRAVRPVRRTTTFAPPGATAAPTEEQSIQVPGLWAEGLLISRESSPPFGRADNLNHLAPSSAVSRGQHRGEI